MFPRPTIRTILLLLTLPVWALCMLPASCSKEPRTRGLQLLNLEQPPGFPAPVYDFADNPRSEEGVELGRRLFYDSSLSADGKVSCGSCHEQRAVFGTFEHDRSHGVFDSHTLRNAPPLFNLAWHPNYHWDGEFTRLTDAVAQPINGHHEMGMHWESFTRKLRERADYREAFRQVFGDGFIRPLHVQQALAQFIGGFISNNSKYDRVQAGRESFTAREASGYRLFQTHCESCHREPLFTDFGYYNNGLALDPSLNDLGRMRVTGRPADSLKFRVPSLRNVYLTSNYMHDGRLATVQQCINHYRFGVQNSATLDPRLRGGITLTGSEAVDLEQFLRTLSDSSLLLNPKLGNPY